MYNLLNMTLPVGLVLSEKCECNMPGWMSEFPISSNNVLLMNTTNHITPARFHAWATIVSEDLAQETSKLDLPMIAETLRKIATNYGCYIGEYNNVNQRCWRTNLHGKKVCFKLVIKTIYHDKICTDNRIIYLKKNIKSSKMSATRVNAVVRIIYLSICCLFNNCKSLELVRRGSKSSLSNLP